MTTSVAPARTRVAQGTSMTDAATVILYLVWVIGGDRKDRGLLTRLAQGRRHVPTCQSGMYVQAGDSLRGGQPCSERCERAHDALSVATVWLKAHEQPAQLSLLAAGPDR